MQPGLYAAHNLTKASCTSSCNIGSGQQARSSLGPRACGLLQSYFCQGVPDDARQKSMLGWIVHLPGKATKSRQLYTSTSSLLEQAYPRYVLLSKGTCVDQIWTFSAHIARVITNICSYLCRFKSLEYPKVLGFFRPSHMSQH